MFFFLPYDRRIAVGERNVPHASHRVIMAATSWVRSAITYYCRPVPSTGILNQNEEEDVRLKNTDDTANLR